MENKICSKCKKLKPITEYYISKRDGIFSHCKECNSKKSLEYFNNHREERLEILRRNSKLYSIKNKEKVKIAKENWRKNNKKYMSDYKKKYRHTEHGKLILKKSKEKRYRNKGFVPIMENPFPDDIQVDYHHINNLLVIPIPKITHQNNFGHEHINKCNVWIQKLFCLDVEKLLN